MLLSSSESVFSSYLNLYIAILLVVLIVFFVSLAVRVIAGRRLKAEESAYEHAISSDPRLRFIRHDLENYTRVFAAGNMNMDSLVKYIVEDKEKSAGDNGIAMTADVKPLQVDMDVKRATALLTNLLDNAIEASVNAAKAGCETPFVHVVISAKQIYVMNSKPEDVRPIERNFETVKENAGMHGMGMTIIRRVTEDLGGRIEMKDNGDTFEIRICFKRR